MASETTEKNSGMLRNLFDAAFSAIAVAGCWNHYPRFESEIDVTKALVQGLKKADGDDRKIYFNINNKPVDIRDPSNVQAVLGAINAKDKVTVTFNVKAPKGTDGQKIVCENLSKEVVADFLEDLERLRKGEAKYFHFASNFVGYQNNFVGNKGCDINQRDINRLLKANPTNRTTAEASPQGEYSPRTQVGEVATRQLVVDPKIQLG